MSNLAARLLTAVVLLPILIAAILWSNPIAVWALVFLATFIGLREFYDMTLAKEAAAERAFGIACGMALAFVLYWYSERAQVIVLTLAAVTLGGFLFYLFRYRNLDTVAARMGYLLTGVLYVALLLTFIALMKKRLTEGAAWVFITLTCTWFSDTGAYFAGRFLGPRWPAKLYPAISPKKTAVGGVGGLTASFLALLLAKLWYLPGLSLTDCLLVAVPANLLGQLGDLCESMLKRSVGVKDSGRLLPGHGGMLDRIDALLFCSPYIYFYARFVYGR